jgi:hypothetical protein
VQCWYVHFPEQIASAELQSMQVRVGCGAEFSFSCVHKCSRINYTISGNSSDTNITINKNNSHCY